MTRWLAALPLLAVLGGCGGPEPRSGANDTIVITGNDNELIVPTPRGAGENVVDPAAITLPGVRLEANGVALSGNGDTSRRAAFGMSRAEVLRILAPALGNPIEEGDSQECGAGTLGFATFREGLGLYFEDGKFAGWDLDGSDGGRFFIPAGVGIGSTRAKLEAASPVKVEDSTLGIEFSAGGISGLLSARDPAGQITNLWAGVTCIAR
jgi:hypothetical protein